MSEKIIVKAGRRLALQKSDYQDDWYMSHSPRNDNGNAEGSWEEWVAFAKNILEQNDLKKMHKAKKTSEDSE